MLLFDVFLLFSLTFGKISELFTVRHHLQSDNRDVHGRPLPNAPDYQDKPPYKISTQYLKAFRSYPIVKFARGHPTSIRHQPLANYSPRRNLFRRGQKYI